MSVSHHAFEASTDIAKLNELIGTHVKQHIPDIELRYDEPNPASPPDAPTLHLFMYLVHEDLNIRHSSRRDYNPKTGEFAAEVAYIRCLYLVTYWDNLSNGNSDSPGAQPGSPTVLNLTGMLKALLCMRNHADFKEYMLRVIEPEALNSLGNFWQALGNKPRAIINFSVTLPVSIRHPNEVESSVLPVKSLEHQLIQFNGVGLAQLEAHLFDELRQALRAQQAELALTKVVINIQRVPAPPKAKIQVEHVEVVVAGVTFSATKEMIESHVLAWQGKTFSLAGQEYLVTLAQHSLVAP